jgi:hypothetical protein
VPAPDDNTVCLAPVCGDGQLSGDEECDPPDGERCDDGCQRIAVCGDARIDVPESCDPPDGVVCDTSCQLMTEVCGNGTVEAGETCDPPDGRRCDEHCASLVPQRWRCAGDLYADLLVCDCGCGELDPDCPDPSGEACQACTSPGSCAADLDCSVIDPQDNSSCAL